MPSISDVYVTVFPETSKIAAGIKEAFREVDGRETGRRLGGEIEQGIGKPKVELKADTAKAEAQIGDAARDRRAKVTVDVDRSQLDRLNSLIAQGQFKQAGMLNDLLKARRDLSKSSYNDDPLGFTSAFLRAQKTASDFTASLGSKLAPQAASAGAQVGTSMGGALTPVLMGAGIAALAGIASAASGLAGLLPAAIGGAGLGIGTLVVGLDGVKDAWDAVGKAAKDSGSDQAAKSKEVASATRTLNAAVKDEAIAQKDVANARKDAMHQLRDLNLELRGGALDEKQAQLDLAQAQNDLATGTFKNSLDYEQAQLRVMQAQQRVDESHQRGIDMQEKANDTLAKGVDGADGVVAATNRLADTQDRVAQAQQGLFDANNKVSASAKSAAEAMALLSPAGQTLITTLQGMMPQFQAFKFAIQDALLTGLGPQIQQLATTYLPLLQTAMGSMASTMNQAFGSLAQLFQTPEMLASMQSILGNISGSFATWSQSIVPLAQAFTKLTEVGASFLPQLADGAVQAAQSFAQFISEASQSGQLQQWIQTGITTMTQLGGIIQQLGPIFLALAPIGTAVLTGIQTILASLAPSIGPLSTAFASLIVAITPILGVIGQLVSTVITSVAPALTMWLNTLAPVIQQMAGLFQPVLEALAPVLRQVAGTLANSMIEGIRTLLPVLVPFVAQMGQLLIAVLPLVDPLVKLAISALPVVQQALALLLPFMTKWVEMCTNLVKVVIPPLTWVVETMGKMFVTQFNAIKGVVGPVWDFVRPILEKMKSLLDDITGPLKALGLIPSDLGSGGSGAHGGAVVPKGSGNGIIPIGPPFTGMPGTSGAPAWSPTGPGGVGTGIRPSGGGWAPAPSPFATPPGADWDKIAQGESGGNWQTNTDNGFFGGLQFTQSTWDQFKPPGSPARADQATKEQQIAAAEATLKAQGPGAWPNTFVPATGQSAMPNGSYAPTGSTPSGNIFTGPHTDDTHGALVPDAAQAKALIQQTFGISDIGGYRPPDKYKEHSSGEALDVMVGANKALGEQVNQFLLQNAQALGLQYTLFEQTQWNPNGTSSGMPDRGSPTDNHMDHVHARFQPGMAASGQVAIPGMPTGTPTDPTYIALSPNIPAGQQAKSKGGSGGDQLGQDFVSGIAEMFGLGDIFPDPMQFGLVKIFKGLMGLKPAQGGGSSDGGSAGGGGGGGGLGDLLSFIPKAVGDLNIGSPKDAPGQFMPMPGQGGGGGGGVYLPNMFNNPGQQPGPGNQQQAGPTIDMSGSSFGYSQTQVQDQIQHGQTVASRQPLRALPS